MKKAVLFFFTSISIMQAGFSPVEAASLKTEAKLFSYLSDRQQLEELIRKAYDWVETKNSDHGFLPAAPKKGSKYKMLSSQLLRERLEELKKTNFFSKEFLDNYNKIGLKLDENLRRNKYPYGWQVGDMPPFGNGASPWCNCQDYPDEYWKTMRIKNLTV